MLESSTWYSRMPAFTIGVVRYCGRETASIAELRECRIRVNAISPGNINTPIFEGWQQGDGLTKMKEELAKNVPLGRLGDPDEIAKAVAFLASDEASYIAGIDLTVHNKGSNMIMPADCQGGFASFDTRPSHDQLLFEVPSDIKRLSEGQTLARALPLGPKCAVSPRDGCFAAGVAASAIDDVPFEGGGQSSWGIHNMSLNLFARMRSSSFIGRSGRIGQVHHLFSCWLLDLLGRRWKL